MGKFELVVDKREDAEQLLDSMREILKSYSMVTVSDLKELIGANPTYEDTQRGWVNLDDAKVDEGVDGFEITFPPTENLITDNRGE